MSRARRDWNVDRLTGSLALSMEVDVNGTTLRSSVVISEGLRYSRDGIPAEYAEQQIRRSLMRAVEDHLLGPATK